MNQISLDGWLGSKVRLKACHDSGDAGTVIRAERGKLTVYWPDMDYWSRHPPDSLELAEPQPREADHEYMLNPYQPKGVKHNE